MVYEPWSIESCDLTLLSSNASCRRTPGDWLARDGRCLLIELPEGPELAGLPIGRYALYTSEEALRRDYARSRPYLPAQPRPARGWQRERRWRGSRPVWRSGADGRAFSSSCSSASLTLGPGQLPCACPALRVEAPRYPAPTPNDCHAPRPESFLREVLWPEFEALNEALVGYLAEVTARIIRDEVHGETEMVRSAATQVGLDANPVDVSCLRDGRSR